MQHTVPIQPGQGGQNAKYIISVKMCIGTSGDHYLQELPAVFTPDCWTQCKYLPGVKSAANILSPVRFVYECYLQHTRLASANMFCQLYCPSLNDAENSKLWNIIQELSELANLILADPCLGSLCMFFARYRPQLPVQCRDVMGWR